MKGGNDKVREANALLIGGHTINDYPPKYGLAVVGTVHPDRVITNSRSKPGDRLILTKPLGTGIIISAKRNGSKDMEIYHNALNYMMQLNDKAAEIMQKYNVRAATDITGFGLLGHAYKIARESKVTLKINAEKVPMMKGVFELADSGFLPAAVFTNLNYIEKNVMFRTDMDYNLKMICCDAQTSGGMLMSAPEKDSDKMLEELKKFYPQSAIIGEVIDKSQYSIFVD